MTERKWTPGHRAADRMVGIGLISEAQRDGVAFLVNAETAAPEMFEALEGAKASLQYVIDSGNGSMSEVHAIKAIDKALSKARGET